MQAKYQKGYIRNRRSYTLNSVELRNDSGEIITVQMDKDKIVKSMYTYHVKEMLLISTCKQSLLKAGVYLSLAIIGLALMIIPHLLTDKTVHRQRVRYPTDLKYILFMSQTKRNQRNRFHLEKTPEFPTGQRIFIAQNCEHFNCYITYDKNTLANSEDYDAVVFDIDNLKKIDIENLNLTRSPEQLYIFRSSDAPVKYSTCRRDLDHFFNWTWTYKLNSDVVQPFFNIYYKNNTIAGPKIGMKWIEKMNRTDNYSTKKLQKTKAVAWIVNKCKLKNKHQDFIEELRNELKGYNYTVDLYGSCGTHKCSGIVKCSKMLENTYHFQLVLEEYFSEDYVTEGIVNTMSRLIIPIVIGAGDYRNFLPPGAYINAQSFEMKKLGALIDYLIKNPETYDYFFDWKNHYYYKPSDRSNVCNLCSQLNKKNKSKTYKRFRYWWNPDYKDTCERMRLYRMFNNEEKRK